MKSLKLFTLIGVIISFTSCTFSEEITFNENGSGKYDMKMDLSSMMGMMDAMQDSTQTEMPEKMDTIMYMKDFLESNKGSVNELTESDKKLYEALKDMKVWMKMDSEKSLFTMDFMLDFKKISDLDDIQEKVKLAQKLQENKVEETDPTNHKVTYEYSRKSFARKVEMLNLSSEEQAKFDETIEQSAMFLGGSTYQIKYNFPYKIKSTSLKGGVISEDKKSITYQIEMDAVLKNPKELDFTVKF